MVGGVPTCPQKADHPKGCSSMTNLLIFSLLIKIKHYVKSQVVDGK
jgi:hypothetical protein